MKRMALILTMAFGAGCVRRIPLTPVEECAVQGMALEGVAMTSGNAHVYMGNGRFAHGVSYGQSVSCRQPSREELCSIQAAQRSAALKLDYSPMGRNVVLFIP